MHTAVKEGVNVETGTRKVSTTTDLVRHSTARLQGQARGPPDPTHALIVPSFKLHALSNNFKLGAFSPGP